MVIVISDICKPTVETMARLMLMRVTRDCLDKPTFSWRFKLDQRPLQAKVACQMQSTRKSLSSGEAEFYVLNLRMRCLELGHELLEGSTVGAP